MEGAFPRSPSDSLEASTRREFSAWRGGIKGNSAWAESCCYQSPRLRSKQYLEDAYKETVSICYAAQNQKGFLASFFLIDAHQRHDGREDSLP